MSPERARNDGQNDRVTEDNPLTEDEEVPRETDIASSFSEEALAADLRALVTKIEEIHPDPYHGYEGRVALHATLESTIRDLTGSATDEEFYRMAAPLVAGLNDAHSRLVPPESAGGEGKRLPLSLRLIGDSVYIDAVYDESIEDLLGARLLGVEGESISTMAERFTELRGSENRYFARMALANRIESYDSFDKLLNRSTEPSAPIVRARTDDGEEQYRSLDLVPSDSETVNELERTLDTPDGTGPRYKLYKGGQTAIFVPGNLSCYREVIQGARHREAGSTKSLAYGAYEEHFNDSPPANVDDIISELPSMVETLTDLVCDMEDAETDSLIVDLRGNTGGDSRFVQYLGYFFYGWETLLEGSDWDMVVKRRTGAHQNRYGIPESARNEYATFDENPADYDFGDWFQNREKSMKKRRQDYQDRLSWGEFAGELEHESHEGYYEPGQLVVVTTADTLSSAFAGAALLSEFGADVVGVPSGQAPISFGEAIEVTLPNTGLTAEIAGSMFHWIRNPNGDHLSMSCELTPELFEDRYNRADDAALQLALDWIDGASFE